MRIVCGSFNIRCKSWRHLVPVYHKPSLVYWTKNRDHWLRSLQIMALFMSVCCTLFLRLEW